MRVLLSSTRGAGHFAPLLPFARACLHAGHEVLAAGPPDLESAVREAGLDFWRFDPPPEEELGPVWGRVPTLSREEAEQVVVGEIFGRLNARAAFPRLREALGEWRPDVVLREGGEFASALAAELVSTPVARVATGLVHAEEAMLAIAAPAIDAIRQDLGLPPDPEAAVLRSSPLLTTFPEALDRPSSALRFADPAWTEAPSPLPDWWDGAAGPLVYVTFGSEAGAMEMTAPVYRAALDAVDGLSARVLLTVGRGADMGAFASPPANVHVEPWVPQADVLAHAAAVVCHGGSGTTLGALAAGRPLVVVPLFADQPMNAQRVAEAGAGLSLPPEAGAIRAATERVLAEPSFGQRAAAIADEMARQPPAEAAVSELERLAG